MRRGSLTALDLLGYCQSVITRIQTRDDTCLGILYMAEMDRGGSAIRVDPHGYEGYGRMRTRTLRYQH